MPMLRKDLAAALPGADTLKRAALLCALCLALGVTPAHGERELALVEATTYPAPGAPVISNGSSRPV
jgi:hypothetical protein